MNRREFAASILAAAVMPLALVHPVLAGTEAVYTGTVPGTGAGGYDVVAYFSEGKARPG